MHLGLIESFANAAFRSGGWVAALEHLARATHSARAQIVGFGGPAQIAFNHIANLGDFRHITEFVEIDGGNPAVNWRVALAGAPLVIQHEQHYEEIRNDRRYDLYNDYAQRWDMIHGCQTVLAAENGGLIGLATLRSSRDGVSSSDDLEMFRDAAPHILRAVRLQQALEHQGAELLAGALEAMDSAAYVANAAGQIVALTPSAEALGLAQDVLALRHKRIRALDRASDQRLQNALSAALRPYDGARASRLWLACPFHPLRGLTCEIYPLPNGNWNFGMTPKVVIVCRPLGGTDPKSHRLLQQIFDLSNAEAEVAILITMGNSRVEVAKKRKVSVETIQAQLKSIFRKVGVRREAQLVAIVSRIAGA